MIADFFKYTFLYLILPFGQRHGRQIIALLLVVGLFLWWGDRQAWFRNPFRATSALEAFSDQTALLLDLPISKRPIEVLQTASYRNAFQQVGVIQQWQNDLQSLEQLFSSTEEHAKLWSDVNIVSGLQVTSSTSAAWLHVLRGYGSTIDLAMLVQALQPDYIERSTYRDHQIYTLTLQDQRWAITQFRGILLLSPTTLLVESGIEQLDKIEGSVYHDRAYHRIARQLDDQQLRLYWHWGNLISLTNVITPTNPRLFMGLRRVGTWAGSIWRSFEQGFQLQGLTYPAPDHAFLRALARQQAPQQSKVVELLPDNFSALLYWGWSDVNQLYRASKTSGHPDFERYVLPWLGEDVTFLYEDPTDEEHAFAKNQLLFVHCPDTTMAWKLLQQYAEKEGGGHAYAYQNFEINHLPVQAPFRPLLGDYIAPLDQPYYTFIGTYVVFGNAKSTIEGWVKRFNTRAVLVQDSLYSAALGQLRSGSNLYALVNTPNATKLVQYLTRAEQEAMVLDAFQGVQQLYPLGVQWHGQGDHFKLSLAADYHPQTTKRKVQAASSWQADLEAPAIIAPQPIRSHDGNYYVVVQDANHRLYLLDKNGENRWDENLVLTRPINSPIYAVDFYSNQQVQYAFSTDSAIYVLNQEGKRLVTIPLIHRASSGVAVMDYGKGPRFFIACRNGAVYGYEESGKPLSGWQPRNGVGQVPTPMQYLSYQDQRYFVAVTKAGTCRAFQRNGEPYFLQGRLGMGLTGWGIDPDIGRMAAGNRQGHIRVLNTKGKGFGIKPVDELRAPVQFMYADVVEDERKDYIRVDAEHLAIHAYKNITDEAGKPKSSLEQIGLYTIPTVQNRVIFPIHLQGRSKVYIGYWDEEHGSIGLLDAKGQLQRGFPLAGTSQFSVVDLFNEKGNTLVVANGNRVYTYRLK